MFGDVWQDLRYGARSLLNQPAFTVIAVLTLALGIGANTAMFSLVNGVLLRPLAYKNSEQLVLLKSTNVEKGFFGINLSYPDFTDWKMQSRSFAQMAAVTTTNANLSGAGEPERLAAASVTPEYFSVLGVNLIQGRSFLPEEQQAGRNQVVILSESLWRRSFGAEPQILGRTITLNSNPYTVIGIAPDDGGYFKVDLWGPLTITPNFQRRNNRFLPVVARLKPDATLTQAQAELDTITRQLQQAYPETNEKIGGRVVSMQQEMVGDVSSALLMLLGATGLVLLIACANITSLLLSRAIKRQREVAIRAALGASRWRILRQLLAESALLASIGGVVGLMVAVSLVSVLRLPLETYLPRAKEVGFDGRVFIFTLGLSLLAGIMTGLAPALQTTKLNLQDALKESGTASAGIARTRLRSILVVAEIALALVLMIGAGLLLNSFARLLNTELGFNPDNVLTLRLTLPSGKYPRGPATASFNQQLLDRLKLIPALESVSAASHLPFGGSSLQRGFIREGAPIPSKNDQAELTGYSGASPDYFRTLNIAITEGREFAASDTPTSAPVAIINQKLARYLWPNQSPIGQRVHIWTDEDFPREVVGVAAEVKQRGPDDQSRFQVYVPYQQFPVPNFTLALRAKGETIKLMPEIRSQIAAIDKDLALHDVKLMTQRIANGVASRRMWALLLGSFAALALLLTAIGIYGVIAYSVNQRTREIGIRLALGARQTDVLRLVLGHGLKLILCGMGLGLIGAFAVTRSLANLLYQIKPTDPLTYLLIALVLLVVALLACYLPARRAAKVDPLVALRYE